MPRPDHIPDGWPHCTCGHWAIAHRVEHTFEGRGIVCYSCKLPRKNHRDKRVRGYRDRRLPPQWWGLDGEGQGREDHRYTFLAVSDESGEQKLAIEAPEGGRLRTVDCFEFLLSLPHPRLYAYSFNYDLTMMLRDLPNRLLWGLFHEDKRPRAGSRLPPLAWKSYSINIERTKFTLARLGGKRRKVIIWDIWKFFQAKFTKALKDWQIGSKEEIAEIERMKEQRSEFDKLDAKEVKEYCFSECSKIGILAHKLTEAHTDAGLKLRNYYGAGSTSSAVLDSMNIKRKRGVIPDEMEYAVACGFFGGRFENSVIGPIPGPVWSYDISSAYPYHIAFLPCMLHGKWMHTKRRKELEGCKTALVRYSLGKPKTHEYSWGPFPFRDSEGAIVFPIQSDGGWVYLEEYLAGERLFSHVRFHEAYTLESDCDCVPFDLMAFYYKERARLGNDGRGYVLKLGYNGGYGKLAQSVGETVNRKPPYQQWVWAGLITSNTRAQILTDVLGKVSSQDQLLMVATDGVYLREPLDMPLPKDTGTYDTIDSGTGLPKPLGGWVAKDVPSGVFCARPGIYFPLNPTKDELKEVRARGIGKSVLLECWRNIVDAHAAGDMTVTIDSWKDEKGEIQKLSRFIGGKSGTRRVGPDSYGQYDYRRASNYGQWVHRPIEMSFDPLPKRERVCEDGVTLELRRLVGQSEPYKRSIGMKSPEALLLQAAQLEADESPDGGNYAIY